MFKRIIQALTNTAPRPADHLSPEAQQVITALQRGKKAQSSEMTEVKPNPVRIPPKDS